MLVHISLNQSIFECVVYITKKKKKSHITLLLKKFDYFILFYINVLQATILT